MPWNKLGVVVVIGLWLTSHAAAQVKPPAETRIPPAYPRVNVAPWYAVDHKWPQKPASYEWKAVSGIAVDQQDQVYVFTRSTPPVQVYKSTGEFVRAWGDDTIGKAHHLKIDRDGTVWVSDIGLHVIRQFTPDGKVLRTIGIPGEKGQDERRLNMPTDVAVTPSGEVFVSDGYGNNRVVHIDAQNRFVKEWGQMGIGPKDFSLPHAIALDSKGRLYVCDRNNNRIQIYSQAGELLDSWANVMVPWGFWVTEQDEIWVCGSSPMPWRNDPKYPNAPVGCPPKDQVVMKFNTAGRVLQMWTIPKGDDGQEQPGDVNWVHCLAFDSRGDLYLGDIIGMRAQKFVRQK